MTSSSALARTSHISRAQGTTSPVLLPPNTLRLKTQTPQLRLENLSALKPHAAPFTYNESDSARSSSFGGYGGLLTAEHYRKAQELQIDKRTQQMIKAFAPAIGTGKYMEWLRAQKNRNSTMQNFYHVPGYKHQRQQHLSVSHNFCASIAQASQRSRLPPPPSVKKKQTQALRKGFQSE